MASVESWDSIYHSQEYGFMYVWVHYSWGYQYDELNSEKHTQLEVGLYNVYNYKNESVILTTQ